MVVAGTSARLGTAVIRPVSPEWASGLVRPAVGRPTKRVASSGTSVAPSKAGVMTSWRRASAADSEAIAGCAPKDMAIAGIATGRCVVDAIAGHGNHPARFLQRLHDGRLLIGTHAGKDMGLPREARQQLWRHRGDLRRIDDAHRRAPGKIEFAGTAAAASATASRNGMLSA